MTDTPLDPHEVLGVPRNATREQINSAYRQALRRLHPDTGQASGSRVTLADLQAARRLLHRRADRREHNTEQPKPNRVETPVRVHLARHFAGPRPDIVVGPVRYHGPAR